MSNCVPNLELSSWQLPETIIKYYQQNGIKKFLTWQVDCLNSKGVLQSGANLVYSAPTSAGKSLVSDVLLFKTLLQPNNEIKQKKKAIIILPLISMAVERVQTLKQLYRRAGIRIDSLAGSLVPPGGLDQVDVVVCTIEKANNLINRLIEEDRLSEIGIIVVDELHMLGDPSRGYLLELLLTKVLFNSDTTGTNVQIVGMSATIPNLSSIAKWLKAERYIFNDRPIKLLQKIVCENQVFQVSESDNILDPKAQAQNPKLERTLKLDYLNIKEVDAPLIYSSIETIIEGFPNNCHSALIFCAKKDACENTSISIAKNIYEFVEKKKKKEPTIGRKLKVSLTKKKEKIEALINTLKLTAFNTEKLEKLVQFGVAFHHGGLSLEERSLIEKAFRDGTIRILCSTSTLSTGVNLPAHRVLISSPFDYKSSLLDAASYRHMIGRAGRMGIEKEYGESMLFCKEKDYQQVVDSLVHANLPPIKSCLLSYKNEHSAKSQSSANLKRAILEAIGNGTVDSDVNLLQYMQRTFFHATNASSEISLSDNLSCTIEYLIIENLIYRQNKEPFKLKILPLGKAIVASGLEISDGQFICKELEKAQNNLSLETDLHLIYLVTSTYVSEKFDLEKIDWDKYLKIFKNLNSVDKSVADRIGVNEQFIMSCLSLQKSIVTTQGSEQFQIHKRFYASLALNDIAQEIPLQKVITKYKLPKADIELLQKESASYTGQLINFCDKLGWRLMQLLIEQYQTRLTFGIKQEDMADLMRLPFLNSFFAKQLFQRGFDSLDSIVNCDAMDLEDALISSCLFKNLESSKKETPTEAAMESELNPAVWVKFIPLLDRHVTVRQFAQMILDEARIIVEKEVGKKFIFDENNNSQLSTQPSSLVTQDSGTYKIVESSILDETSNEFNDSVVEEMTILNYSHHSQVFNHSKPLINFSSPIQFDSDKSLISTTTNRLNLKRPLAFSMDDCESNISNKKFATPNNVATNQNSLTFFQAFSQLGESSLPSSFESMITTKIPINKYRLVQVDSEEKCQQLLDEVFSKEMLYNSDVVLDVAVHFRILPLKDKAKPNDSGLLINNRHPMELKELNLVRLGCSHIFQINTIDMFECLRKRLEPWLDDAFRVFESSSSDSSGSKQRIRFLTYDQGFNSATLAFGHLP